MKKDVLRNFAKFTGKHLCNFIKKETMAQMFSCEFCEVSKNTFFTEHLWTTASNDLLWNNTNEEIKIILSQQDNLE